MQLELSQDDLRVMLRIITENLGEAVGLDPGGARQEVSLHVPAARAPPTGLKTTENTWNPSEYSSGSVT